MENDSRTNNSIRNAMFSTLTQIISLLISFVLRWVFVRTLSSEYLGINGLFTNILTMFSLAELGIGSAIVYAMYKPIAENDTDKILSYMNFYKKAYILIALIIFIIGIAIIPNLSFFIKGNTEIDNLQFIFFLYLIDCVCSYLCVYKISLLNATQKNYINNIYQSTGKIISTIIMCIVLLLTKNFILYLIIQFSFKILTNIIISIKVTKMYPYLKNNNVNKLTKKEKKSISRNVYGLFCNQIGSVLINGTDNIIISKYVSIIAVGLYSNYTLIINAVSNLIGQLFNSIVSSVGNHGVKETPEKTYELFNKIHFINYFIVSFCILLLYSCIDTFISFAFGSQFVMDRIVVIIVLVNFYMLTMKNVVGTFKYALGIFWDDKYSNFIRAIINLIFSIVLTIKFGIVGVFLGTFISDILTTFWFQPYILFKKGFNKNVFYYFADFFKYSFITGIEIVIIFIINKYLIFTNNSLLLLVIQSIECIALFLITNLLLFKNNNNFKYLKNIFMNKLKKRRDNDEKN